MTREEEIKEKSKEYLPDGIWDDDYTYKVEFVFGFQEGAKWADKHPKRYNQDELCDIQLEMMKQRDKRLIEKACKWLKENIDTYAKVVINPKSHYPEIVMCDTFEKNFKKAMEK